jgi:ABC-2 type transport system permease protein
MSPGEAVGSNDGSSKGGRTNGVRAWARLFRSELALVFRRRRNIALLAVLALVPVLIGVAVKLAGHPGRGGSIFGSITDNGIFTALAAYLVMGPLFLPLVTSVVAGDSIAGESSAGTIRYLLVAPVGRTRLLTVKFASVLVWCAADVVLAGVSGLLTGAVLFRSGRLTLLSGRQISFVAGCYRLMLVALFVVISVAVVGALGLFVSTMTEVPLGAMAATLVLTIVSEVLDQVPQLSAIHPALPSHYWLRWVDLLRDPMLTTGVWRGVLVGAAYVAVLVSLAWARFTSKDVTA